MRVSENESEIAQILEDGLKDGSIAIPESSPGQEDVFRHIASFTAYLREFGDKIAGCDAGGSSGTGAGGLYLVLAQTARRRSGGGK